MRHFHRFLSCLALFIFTALFIVSCNNAPSTTTSSGTASSDAAAQTLNIYNWSTYIAPESLEAFQKQFNVKIKYDTFESNDALYAKLKPGNPGYDVIFPADYMVKRMKDEGMLETLNLAKIPNLKNLDPKFANPAYDAGNQHSAAYQWGTLGIGYNSEKTKKTPDSWGAMFDSQYQGRVAWLDDVRYTLGAVLIYLGFDPNTTNPDEILKAKNTLIAKKGMISAFAPDTGQNLLNQGEVDLTFEYSGDIFQVMEENKALNYAIPKEGTIVWVDNMAIPKGAPHQDLANEFINFILEPKVGAQISNFIHYGSPNKTAVDQKLIAEADLKNPSIYPSPEVFKKLKVLKDVGENIKLYDAAWTEVKVGVS
ncbi:MAG: spermidine/putrescine ABC transporter substrate-binding protein [Thermosynechococcaceae cyanobacterium]